MDKIITIYDVFELNRVLHSLLEQQSSYKIQTAFKIHSLIKWLDETEGFIFERMSMIFGTTQIDFENDEIVIAGGDGTLTNFANDVYELHLKQKVHTLF